MPARFVEVEAIDLNRSTRPVYSPTVRLFLAGTATADHPLLLAAGKFDLVWCRARSGDAWIKAINTDFEIK